MFGIGLVGIKFYIPVIPPNDYSYQLIASIFLFIGFLFYFIYLFISNMANSEEARTFLENKKNREYFDKLQRESEEKSWELRRNQRIYDFTKSE